jgi:hypothetical protein
MNNKKISKNTEEESFNIEEHIGCMLSKVLNEDEESFEKINDSFNENLNLNTISKNHEKIEFKQTKPALNLDSQRSLPQILINNVPCRSPMMNNDSYNNNFFRSVNNLQLSPNNEIIRTDKRKVQTMKHNENLNIRKMGNLGNIGNFQNMQNPNMFNMNLFSSSGGNYRSENFNSFSTNTR